MPKDPHNIKLSILILSIPSRFEKMQKLINKLELQIENSDEVEILSLVDNKSFHIYEKRNELLDMARGDYICFLDDDDSVTDQYVPSILDAMESNPDVISFKQHCNYNGYHFDVYFDINHEWDPMDQLRFNGTTFNDLKRPPFHMCPFKSEIAKSEKFLEKYDASGQSCEDADWLLRLYPKIETQIFIDEVLHNYIYNSQETESILK